MDFYTRAAQQTDDANDRRMFQDLAEMEQGHMNLLEGEYRFLLEQFHTTMSFAPF